MKTRLEEHYLTAVRPALIEKFGYANAMQAPKLEKIVINMGLVKRFVIRKKSNMLPVSLLQLLVRSRL